MNFNKAIILGNVTATPELRTTKSGQPVTRLGIATNRKWTDKSGTKQEEVEFHNVIVWGKQAEIASQYIVKGSLVLVEGRLKTREWTDKDGAPRRATEIICENFQLGPKPESRTTAPATKPAPSKLERPLHVRPEDAPELFPEEEG
jgi:single-strand DNA-binding protein